VAKQEQEAERARARDYMTIQAADSFGVPYEVVVGALRSGGITDDQLISRAEVERLIATHQQRAV
jgi:hypothetical protein